MTAFSPGQSPPPVATNTLFILNFYLLVLLSSETYCVIEEG
jgi:hypothetical protein